MQLNKLVPFLFAMLFISLVGCKSNSTEEGYSGYTDARILSFALKNDTSGHKYANYLFALDQFSGEIFNRDSMPLGTPKDSLYTNVSFSAVGEVYYQHYDAATHGWNTRQIPFKAEDTIHLSVPIRMTVKALNKNTQKHYFIQLNVHRFDPDTMNIRQEASSYAGVGSTAVKTIFHQGAFISLVTYASSAPRLLKSDDGISINQSHSLAGLPADFRLGNWLVASDQLFAVSADRKLYRLNSLGDFDSVILPEFVTCYGVVRQAGRDRIVMLAQVDGKARMFSYIPSTQQVVWSRQILSEELPVERFTATDYTRSGRSYLTLVGGYSSNAALLNSVFEISIDKDTLQCSADLTASIASGKNPLPAGDGGALFAYNGRLYSIRHNQSGGNIVNSLYYSADFGIHWQAASKKENSFIHMSPRTQMSVVVDDKGRIYLYGGTLITNDHSDQVWRAYINKVYWSFLK